MPTFRIHPDPDLPGVVRVVRAGRPEQDALPTAELPGPRVGVLAALHGDEPCGLRAHEWLLEHARAGTLAFTGGTLVLVHGNLEATRLGVRYTPDGYDLNRICDLAFMETLPEAEWGYEHHRARALHPLLCALDAGLDLHSAHAPTEPFAIALEGSLEVARQLGVDWVTHGWEEASDVGSGVALARVSERGRPAVAVECGGHGELAQAEGPAVRGTPEQVAIAVVPRFLRALGLWEGPAPSAERPPRVLRVHSILGKPSRAFRFLRPLRGFERLEAGQPLGSDREREVRCPIDCVALMPNDEVPLGKPYLYLALESA